MLRRRKIESKKQEEEAKYHVWKQIEFGPYNFIAIYTEIHTQYLLLIGMHFVDQHIFLRASVYWLPLAEPFSSYLNIRYTQQNGFKAFLFTIEYFIYQWNLGPWRMRHPNYTNYDHKNGFVCSSLVKREREIRTEVCVWLCTGMSITDYGIDR